jgi:hypothetical protein
MAIVAAQLCQPSRDVSCSRDSRDMGVDHCEGVFSTTMPVTRSSSSKPVQTLLAFPNQQKKASQSSRAEPDVITISSSSEDEMADRPSQPPASKKHAKRRREKSKASVPQIVEIFDLSSEEIPEEVGIAAALHSKIQELERVCTV